MINPIKLLCFSLLFVCKVNCDAQTISYSDLYTSSTFTKTIDVSKPVGSIAGAAGTSPTGAATYSIPISCPPGTNGMVPNLSIVYNSQGGNGLLGQGWNLSGLSAITRAGWDTYHYGKVAPVSYQSLAPYLVPTSGGSAYVFEKSDAFVLDGSYLYPKSGTYGANGSTYNTESESYSVTTATGSVGGGPDYFTVVGKDGTTVEFGRSATSKFYTNDGSRVMMWRISKIIDINGNFMEFIYDNSARESRIVKIKYTGHTSGMSPYNEINFYYSERSDKNTLYDGGNTMQSKYLLWQIQVVAESETFKTYQFNYGKNETGMSYLKNVLETASDGSTLNDTRFKYGEKTTAFVETLNSDNITLSSKTLISNGDFDGDGLTDFLVSEYELIPGTEEVYNINLKIKKRALTSSTYNTISTLSFSGSGVRIENASKKPYYTQRKVIPQFSDFNGDGRDDIIISNYNTTPISSTEIVNTLDYIHIYYANSDGSVPGSPSYIYTPPSIYSAIIKGGDEPKQENYLQIGDFDGDGSADFITMLGGAIYFHSPRKSIANKTIAQVNLNSGTIPSTAMSLVFDLLFKQADEIYVINMDGDAKSDLMVVTNGTTRVFTMNFDAVMNDLHLNQIGANLNYPTTWHDINLGDFNGDGKTDILTGSNSIPTANWSIGYSDGKGFVEQPFIFEHPIGLHFSGLSISMDKIVIADFNGDGKSDILDVYSSTSSTYEPHLYTSNGLSFHYQNPSPLYNVFITDNIVPGDFNGDSKSEIFFRGQDRSTSVFHTLFNNFNAFDKSHLLEKVTDGFNRTTEFAYEPLTKGTGSGAGDFYIKGSGETYPVNNVQIPLYVTTSMKAPDGVGGINTSYFSYANLRLHRAGRGLLGFEKVKSYNVNANLRTESNFDLNRTFYIPYLKNSKTFLNSTGLQLSQLDNTVDFILKPATFSPSYTYTGMLRVGGKEGFKQQATSSIVKDLQKGVTTTTTNTFDADGNVTYSTSTTTGGGTFTTSTATNYIATGGSSLPNRPSEIISTSQRGSQPSITTINKISYRPNGLLEHSTIMPAGTGSAAMHTAKTSFEYDFFGNVIKETKSSLLTSYAPYSRYEYDSKGRFVVKEEDMLGAKKEYTVHKFWGTPTNVKDYNGLTTTFNYNAWGKLLSNTVPTSASTSYIVNYSEGWDIGTDQLYYTLTQDPSAPDVKTWYDCLNRAKKISKESFGGAWTTAYTNYDAKGNLSNSSNFHLATEAPQITTNTYDEFNRIKSSTSIAGTTGYAYSPGGGNSLTTITLPDGTIKKTKVDASGKIIESTNGNAGTVVFEYDSRGNELRTGVKGGWGGIISYPITKEYDVTGQLSKMIDMDAGTTKYNYNPLGQLISQEDPKGKTTTFVYDINGRITQKTLHPYVTTYTYFGADKDYRLKEAKVNGPDGIVTEYFDYHIGGGVGSYFKDIKGTIFAKTYTYDAYNRLLSSTDNIHVSLPSGGVFYCAGSGFGTVNEYDANGYIKKISSNTTPSKVLYEAILMNGSGQVTTFKRPGGMLSSINYTNNVPTQYNTNSIQDLRMTYDFRNGNVLSRKEETIFSPAIVESFAYDNIDRLTKSDVAATISGVTGPLTTHSIVATDYDKFVTSGTGTSSFPTLSYGRIISKSDVGNYVYSGFPANAVKQILTAPGTSVISHETQDIVYNLFDKTQTISEKIGSTFYEEKMVYDASEDRTYTQQSQGLSATALGVTRQRWYVGDYEKQVIASNTQHIHYINSDAGIVAMVVKDASGYHYYPVFTDHLGSIVKVTDETGATVAEQNFDAWGRERNPASWKYDMAFALPKPNWLYRGYTGHEMLSEYGLINMNGRMYDPANGRMLRPDNYVQDPLNTQSYNRYSYCFNNPLKYTDPTGDYAVIDDVIAALIGGTINWASNGCQFNSSGAKYFGVGVAGGVASLYVTPVVGAALVGAGNAAISSYDQTGRVDGAAVFKGAMVSGVVGGLTMGIGNAVAPTVGSTFAGISSPALQNGLTQGAIGAGLGGATAFVMGGDGDAILKGAAWGLGTGLATGMYAGVRQAHRDNVNPWTGKSNELIDNSVATKVETVKYLGRMEDLNGIPRSQTILDELPNLGNPKANYYQNMSAIRKNLRDGVIFKDASWFRPNSEPAPLLPKWPTRTVGQTFYGAERNLMINRGLWPK